ncbi:hypothetical protein GGTG_10326 [Gaeumannomyces tritici R3-111a-1]|uniref:Uncharacterized protein n=1 Tax=Gaeumannomyces tritici (strain R3-111a-1) TaxID=644352 RepID=J3PA02_GAET3|nr:hypothetical protein GGTG_10326 [Gaeumannomyces tritici R3-111a-1]EJT73488.1 hypothetical protein GGTG_10326 [Gaeumannomyces tritici R3-111a-1]
MGYLSFSRQARSTAKRKSGSGGGELNTQDGRSARPQTPGITRRTPGGVGARRKEKGVWECVGGISPAQKRVGEWMGDD